MELLEINLCSSLNTATNCQSQSLLHPLKNFLRKQLHPYYHLAVLYELFKRLLLSSIGVWFESSAPVGLRLLE